MKYKIKEKNFNWFVTDENGETRVAQSKDISDLISWEQAVSMKSGKVVTIDFLPDFDKLPLVDEALNETEKL